jgi:hypothetical protein
MAGFVPEPRQQASWLIVCVMAGLVPAIHDFRATVKEVVDGRPSPAMTVCSVIEHGARSGHLERSTKATSNVAWWARM